MILTEERTNVKNTLAGESRAFSIATNAKAFRILVDGIYSDAIGSIARELLSNAWDAHVRRGVLDLPFEVRLPNSMNPSFSVRDYGCSMEHEFVMDSYSTLFESSKSASNNEVGAFGLGAKVFLAYTDACTLNCWLNGEVRAYTVTLNEQGVPTVTLVHRGPSAEPQGVEVTFAVHQKDFQEFNRAVARAALGFDLIPKIVGGDITVPKPDKTGTGWRLYRDLGSAGGAGSLTVVSVRQGCAVYPTNLGNNLPYGYKLVVDVPIGDVTVTASREQLSMTSAERTRLVSKVEAAQREIHAQVQAVYSALTTEIAKAKFAYENSQLLGPGQWPTVVTLPFKLNGIGKTKNSIFTTEYDRFTVQNLPKTYVLWDDGSKVLRKQKRLMAMIRHKSVYLTTDQAEFKAAKTLLDLPDTQVMKLSDIPDVAVVRSTGKGGGAPAKVITSTRIWASADGHFARAGEYAWNRRTENVMRAGGTFYSFVHKLIGSDGILYLTERELKRALDKGTINPDNRIDKVVQRAFDTPDHHEAALSYTIHRTFGQIPHYSRDLMLKRAIGSLTQPMDYNLHEYYQRFFSAKVQQHTRIATEKRDKLARKYPLLFGYDTQAIHDYIAMCEKNLTNTHSV